MPYILRHTCNIFLAPFLITHPLPFHTLRPAEPSFVEVNLKFPVREADKRVCHIGSASCARRIRKLCKSNGARASANIQREGRWTYFYVDERASLPSSRLSEQTFALAKAVAALSDPTWQINLSRTIRRLFRTSECSSSWRSFFFFLGSFFIHLLSFAMQLLFFIMCIICKKISIFQVLNP